MESIKWSTLCNLDKINNILLEDLDINKIATNTNTIKLENINDIIEKLIDNSLFPKKDSLLLLKELFTKSNFINKYYFQFSKNIEENIIKILNYLLQITTILKNRLNLNTIHLNYTLINVNSIPRSSYKFCSFKDNCKYNYDNNNKGCYAHHYVYNLLEYDLNSLLYYINTYTSSNNFCNNKEIIKSLSTINYVIKHMYEELNNICIYTKLTNIESVHKNCIKKKKKYKKKKKNIINLNLNHICNDNLFLWDIFQYNNSIFHHNSQYCCLLNV